MSTIEIEYDENSGEYRYNNKIFFTKKDAIEYIRDNEQYLKDEKSRELNKSQQGGGVLEYQEPTDKMTYPSIYEGITDLYSRANKGDSKAQKQIEQLWNKPNVKRELSRMEKEGITIQSCPNCNYPLTEYMEYCPNCNADLRKLFEHRERVY
jgi:hypothetical protein